ncbi:ecto-ADP-ribosyltransferase 5-like [Misgurnus anguillicaudatus]|uniref:ecto-ADP-ribosyltransferase 5-like n=1 Tax=Misgurnus anguillicaudatus TaxID=75329 RepID=UPI003CCF8965
MLTLAALIFIVTSNVVLGQDDRLGIKRQRYPLNMAEDSVDDRYDGCTEKMEKLVEEKYLNDEITANKSGFGTAWLNSKKNITEPKDNLTEKHLIAIYVYTGVVKGLYKEFNQDVRNGKEKYLSNTFSWYSLHFWLTQAIQKIEKGCLSAYRGTNDTFEGVQNTPIRFGSFASSALNRKRAKRFGNKSCFEIRTCHGANVTKYSRYPGQKEVLIPPYEIFNITNIKKNDWCETVFVFNSTGMISNLNCTLFKPMKYHNIIISD